MYLLSVHCADITVGVGCETHGLSQVFSICVCVCVCVCGCVGVGVCVWVGVCVKGRTEYSCNDLLVADLAELFYTLGKWLAHVYFTIAT